MGGAKSAGDQEAGEAVGKSVKSIGTVLVHVFIYEDRLQEEKGGKAASSFAAREVSWRPMPVQHTPILVNKSPCHIPQAFFKLLLPCCIFTVLFVMLSPHEGGLFPINLHLSH